MSGSVLIREHAAKKRLKTLREDSGSGLDLLSARVLKRCVARWEVASDVETALGFPSSQEKHQDQQLLGTAFDIPAFNVVERLFAYHLVGYLVGYLQATETRLVVWHRRGICTWVADMSNVLDEALPVS